MEPITSTLLGMQWNAEYRGCVFGGVSKWRQKRYRRNFSKICCLVSDRVFDPHGLCTPHIKRMKFLLRILWSESKQNWDDQVECDEGWVFQELQ